MKVVFFWYCSSSITLRNGLNKVKNDVSLMQLVYDMSSAILLFNVVCIGLLTVIVWYFLLLTTLLSSVQLFKHKMFLIILCCLLCFLCWHTCHRHVCRTPSTTVWCSLHYASIIIIRWIFQKFEAYSLKVYQYSLIEQSALQTAIVY